MDENTFPETGPASSPAFQPNVDGDSATSTQAIDPAIEPEEVVADVLVAEVPVEEAPAVEAPVEEVAPEAVDEEEGEEVV